MSADMPPESLSLESQLLSIMDVLVRAAVTEISQLFSESSASLCLQLTQSQKENEALRMRMKVMRSELFSLRLQTRANRPASRFSPGRGSVARPRAKTQGEERFFKTTRSQLQHCLIDVDMTLTSRGLLHQRCIHLLPTEKAGRFWSTRFNDSNLRTETQITSPRSPVTRIP